MPEFKVPATSANLGSGYDTVGIALNLFNYFKVEKSEQLKIEVFDLTGKEINILQSDNLILKAYHYYFNYIKEPPVPALIIEKMQTPLARGLGSSSAAIIGGLLAAALMSKHFISESEFIKLAVALEKHPDNVVPALIGGLIINYKQNNIDKYLKIKLAAELDFVTVIPDFELKTIQARSLLPAKLNYQQSVFNLGRISLLTAAFLTADYQLLKAGMDDMLHQPYRKQLIPGFEQVIANAYNAGAWGAALSGAGPTFLAITSSKAAEIAAAMEAVFKRHKIAVNSYILKGYNKNTYQLVQEEALDSD